MPNKMKDVGPKICEACGKEYRRLMREPGVRVTPENVPHFMRRRFCSKKCAQVERIVYPETQICKNPQCGKEIRGRNSHARPRQYCGVECRNIGARKDPNTTERERKKNRVSLRKNANQHGVWTERKANRRRAKTIRFKESAIKPEHIFPEGPRTEVWRPASWSQESSASDVE